MDWHAPPRGICTPGRLGAVRDQEGTRKGEERQEIGFASYLFPNWPVHNGHPARHCEREWGFGAALRDGDFTCVWLDLASSGGRPGQ
jgi:hypothetical protein